MYENQYIFSRLPTLVMAVREFTEENRLHLLTEVFYRSILIVNDYVNDYGAYYIKRTPFGKLLNDSPAWLAKTV